MSGDNPPGASPERLLMHNTFNIDVVLQQGRPRKTRRRHLVVRAT